MEPERADKRKNGLACSSSLVALLLAGCVSYHPAPLLPEDTEKAFEARSLRDPELAAWARSVLRPDVSFPPEAWDLSSLVMAALWFHPDLGLARAHAEVARAGLVAAGARANPTLGLTSEYSVNPGDASPWVAGLGLELPVATNGKRDLAIEAARRRAIAAALEVGETAWTVRARVRTSLLEVVLLERESASLRAEVDARRRAVDVLRARLSAGEVSHPDVATAEIELTQVEAEMRVLSGRVEASRANLASALGLPVSALADVRVDWPEIERLPTDPPLARARRAGLLNRVDVRRSLLEYDAAEAELELAIAGQVPDFSLTPGYLFDQGQSKWTLGLSLPLALANRNEGPIAEAEARRREAQASFVALQARAIGEIEAGAARYRGSLASLADARALLERQRERESAVAHALAAGESDGLSVAQARVQGAVLARLELAALRDSQEALGALEDALRQPLAEPVTAVDDVIEEVKR